MIILTVSDPSWEELQKALGPDVSVSAPTPGGGKQGGPGSKEREGHKYIHREWKGDHWEYKYAQEPHPERHGMGHVGQESHSIEVHPSVDTSDDSPEAKEAAYRDARKRTLVPGSVFPGTHPKTGEPIEYHVVAHKNFDPTNKKQMSLHPHGVKIVPRFPSTEKTKAGKPKPGAMVPKQGLYYYGSWASVDREQRLAQAEKQTIKDENGNVTYQVRANVGKVNMKEDTLVQTKDPNRFVISITEHAPEYRPGMRKNEFRRKNEAEVKQFLDAREFNAQQVAATKSGEYPPISARLSQGETPLQIMESGTLPKEFDPENPMVLRTKFDGTEQREVFINALVNEISDEAFRAANRITQHSSLKDLQGEIIPKLLGFEVGTGLVGGPYQMTNKDNPTYRYLADAVDRTYSPDSGDSLGAHAYGSLQFRFRDEMEKMGYKMPTEDIKQRDVETLKQDEEAGAPARPTTTAGRKQMVDPSGIVSETQSPEQAVGAKEDVTERISNWRDEQDEHLVDAMNDFPDYENQIQELRDEINNPNFDLAAENVLPFIDRIKQLGQQIGVGDELLYRLTKAINSLFEHLSAALLVKAIKEQVAENLVKAAQPVPPNHRYSHREGSDDLPTYYYQDENGNYFRYTNAPDGHADASPLGGPAAIHPSEPMFPQNSEYYTPDGRKMTRAPFPGAEMQWNPNYHRNDPQNLWAGRWVNPVSGDHEYSYIDSDIREQPKLRIHQMNAIVDVRLPYLRQCVFNMLHSDQQKDVIVGLMLALVDQGRLNPVMLSQLVVSEVQIHGDLIRLGRFTVHAGEKIQQLITQLLVGKNPQDPVFAIPILTSDPTAPIGVGTQYRQVGPHFIARMLERVGTPLPALQSYHATQTYSLQLARCLRENPAISFDCGHNFALLEVAKRMGHDFGAAPDVNQALQTIQQTLIDPVVVEIITQNAANEGLGQGTEPMGRTFAPAIPHVSANLQTRTESERVFNQWLHTHPVHEHAEARNTFLKSGPGGQPRAGHKYKSRKWTGSGWEYDYGDGGTQHQSMQAHPHQDEALNQEAVPQPPHPEELAGAPEGRQTVNFDGIWLNGILNQIKDINGNPIQATDDARLQNMKDMIASGQHVQLRPPIVTMKQDGSMEVVDGRHRILAAAEMMHDIPITFSQGIETEAPAQPPAPQYQRPWER